MLLYAFASDYTLLLIRDLFHRHNFTSYSEMCVAAYGRRGYLLTNFLIFCFNFGGLAGSLIILGTILPDLLTGFFGAHAFFSRWIMITLPFLVVSPIAYYKGIGNFTLISIFSCGSLMFIVALVTYHFFGDGYVNDVRADGTREGGGDAFQFAHHQLLQALGGISYLYTCM